MLDANALDIPPFDGIPRQVAELWRMEKDAHVAVCSVWTHPEGGELRLMVDGKVKLAEATHHLWTLPVLALAWRERFRWPKGR